MFALPLNKIILILILESLLNNVALLLDSSPYQQSMINEKQSNNDLRTHFCWLQDPQKNISSSPSSSLTGFFKIDNLVYTKMEFLFVSNIKKGEVINKRKGCLYHVFDLRKQKFLHHFIRCCDIFGNGK